MISLLLETSSLAQPLRRRRDRGFLVTARVQLSCNAASSQRLQWTIHSCSSSCSTLLQLPPSIRTTQNDLYIPARTLPYGTYQFTFTVNTTAPFQTVSTVAAYIIITASAFTPSLVLLGTSLITHSLQHQDLILSPGLFSQDPDHGTFNATVRLCFSILCFFASLSFRSGVAVPILLSHLQPLQLPQCERLTDSDRRPTN